MTSPEEIMSTLKDKRAAIAEDSNEALQALKNGGELTQEHREEILRILSMRKSNILNLTGLIDEYVCMPCDSLFAKFRNATVRYGRVI